MESDTLHTLAASDVVLSLLKVAAERANALTFDYILATNLCSGRKDMYFRVYRRKHQRPVYSHSRASNIQ